MFEIMNLEDYKFDFTDKFPDVLSKYASLHKHVPEPIKDLYAHCSY